MAFDNPQLTQTIFHNQQQYLNSENEPQVVVALSAMGAIEGTAYIKVTDSGQMFAGKPISVVSLGGQRFSATLMADSSLPVGVYSGTLNVAVCKDADCTNRYATTGAELPYEVTVTEQLAVELYVDGILVQTADSSLNGPFNISTTNNTEIRIRSNIPMAVDAESLPGYYEFAIDQSSTPTNWIARINITSGLVAGASLSVKAGDATKDSQREIFFELSFQF